MSFNIVRKTFKKLREKREQQEAARIRKEGQLRDRLHTETLLAMGEAEKKIGFFCRNDAELRTFLTAIAKRIDCISEYTFEYKDVLGPEKTEVQEILGKKYPFTSKKLNQVDVKYVIIEIVSLLRLRVRPDIPFIIGLKIRCKGVLDEELDWNKITLVFGSIECDRGNSVFRQSPWGSKETRDVFKKLSDEKYFMTKLAQSHERIL